MTVMASTETLTLESLVVAESYGRKYDGFATGSSPVKPALYGRRAGTHALTGSARVGPASARRPVHPADHGARCHCAYETSGSAHRYA